MNLSRTFCTVCLLILIVVVSGCAVAAPKIINVGKAAISPGKFNPHELSGLAYAGIVSGNTYRYLAVSNTQKTIYSMDIKINKTTGAVESANVVSELTVYEGTDLEGIAIQDSSSMWVSDETGPAIRKYSRTERRVLDSISLPEILGSQRENRSLESLAISPLDKSIWTANEEALNVDGDAASIGGGTTVRIFKFASDYSPAGQWVYNVDPIESAFLQKELSGVSDMAILPDGRLLMLERELDGNGFRSRVYLADVKGATDVSSMAGLLGQSYTPVSKSLLWEKRFAFGNFNNYEGISLGPTLQDGSISLLLVSDDNTNAFLEQSLYAMKVSGVKANTKSFSAVTVGAGLAGIVAVPRAR